MRPALLVPRGDERDLHHEGAPRLRRRARPARHHRPRQRADRPVARGSFGYDAETDRRIARCISFLRETPEDNGYARPIEGLIVHFDLGRNEVIEVIDHGVDPLPDAARALLRRGPPAAARRPEAARDHPARGSELHRRRQPRSAGARGRCASASTRTRAWSLHQVTYDDHGRERSVLHRASVSEMVVPYGDPAPLHGWKNAFDAGEWGLGRMTQPLTLGCDCLGEIHYFDAIARERDRRAVHDRERDLPARGGLRDPLEARRPVQRHERGAPQPPARHQLDRDRRQLRVRLLLVPLPRRQHPARGEAHRHRVADGDRAGDDARVRERRRAGRRRAAPPAPVQRPARLRRRRSRQRGLRGRGRVAARGATTTRGATRSARRSRGSRPSRTRGGR